MKNLNRMNLIAAAALAAASLPVLAQNAPAPDVLQLRASAALERDDNVLRQSTGQISDTVGSVSVGASLDKTIGLQRFRGDIDATTYKYNNQSNLDYDTINYNAAWDWSLTTRFHGVLSADRRQAREVSTDPVTFVNRVGRRTEKAELLEGTFDVGARVRALGGVKHTSSESTEPRSWDASPDINSAHVGVGYETPKGTLLTLKARKGDGKYTDGTPGAAAGDFDENEVELAMKWPVTAKTNVEARIAHLRREHDTARQLDFSGMVGGASVSWEVTAKTRLVAGYAHDLVATGLITGGHVKTDRLFFTPVWQFSPQLAVNFRYDRAERRWRDVPVASPDLGRDETVENIGVGLEWEPRRILTVSTSLRQEKLKSNLPGASYRATVFGVAAKARF